MKTKTSEGQQSMQVQEERITIGGNLLNLDQFVEIDLIEKETGRKVELSMFDLSSGVEVVDPDGKKVELNQALQAKLSVAVTYRLMGVLRDKTRTIGVRFETKDDNGEIVKTIQGELTVPANDNRSRRNYDIDLEESH